MDSYGESDDYHMFIAHKKRLDSIGWCICLFDLNQSTMFQASM